MIRGREWNVGDGEVDDIKIEVFDEIVLEDGSTEEIPRQYEKLHDWKDEWKEYEFYKNPNQKPDGEDLKKQESWNKYQDFIKNWKSLVDKRKVPIWYKFDPEDISGDFCGHLAHNSLKRVNEWNVMYEFLKGEKWLERDAEQTEDKKNKYTEKSQFVVDCTQLLGIGGEAVVIRKDVKEKVSTDEGQSDKNQSGEDHPDREYEALKIIPIMKHNFESEKIDEMKNRVETRHDKADPEFNKGYMEREKQRQNRKG